MQQNIGRKENFFLKSFLFALLSCLACFSSTPNKEASPPSVETSQPLTQEVSERIFLCEEIRIRSMKAFDISTSEESLEGGGAEVFVDEKMLRIQGENLGETYRHFYDYRFFKDELICAQEIFTSVHTIYSDPDLGEERVPLHWRQDFRVFQKQNEVIYHGIHEAPGKEERALDDKETVEFAKKLYQLAKETATKTP